MRILLKQRRSGQGSFDTAVMEIASRVQYLAAGPFFKFNESVSFVINCKDQEEVDYYWNALQQTVGKRVSVGGVRQIWFVLQVVQLNILLINSDDPKVREKAMKNTMKQKKIVLSELK